MTRVRRHAVASATLALLAACHEPERREDAGLLPTAGNTEPGPAAPVVRTSELVAGVGTGRVDVAAQNPYEGDAEAEQQGSRLYGQMNCAGCHGPAGGGGIGPPLADAEWIYGGQPENVVQAILEGRPNGMPSFGDKLPESEAWKIATFVLTLPRKAGLASGTDAPAVRREGRGGSRQATPR
jgi:cytochrome c oxidase cbb3-type subunit 3